MHYLVQIFPLQSNFYYIETCFLLINTSCWLAPWCLSMLHILGDDMVFYLIFWLIDINRTDHGESFFCFVVKRPRFVHLRLQPISYIAMLAFKWSWYASGDKKTTKHNNISNTEKKATKRCFPLIRPEIKITSEAFSLPTLLQWTIVEKVAWQL